MAEGVSDNLMDYNDNGTRLHKYQWDFIHNPEGGLYVFQDEEEGAAYSLTAVKSAIEKIRYGYVKNKNIDFSGSIRNISHADNVKLLNSKTYKQIVFAPNKSGTISINPRALKTSGSIINEPDAATGKQSISFYENTNRVLKLLYTIKAEDDKQEFEDYLFPEASVWKKQIYDVKKDRCILKTPTDAGYIIQVDQNTRETSIYKTTYKVETQNKDDDKIRIYKQRLFFLIRILEEPEIRVISEFREELVFSFNIEDGSLELLDEKPQINPVTNSELPEFDNKKYAHIISNPSEAYTYVQQNEPLVLAFYNILKENPDLAKNGELSYLSKLDRIEGLSKTVVDVLLALIESRISDLSLPKASLMDIVESPPEFNQTKTYKISEDQQNDAIKTFSVEKNTNPSSIIQN